MTPSDEKRGYQVLLQIVIISGVLVIWEIAGRLGLLNPLFFPVPSSIFMTSYFMIMSGEISDNLSITLFRVFFGFLLGTIPGIILGMAMGASRKIRLLIDPIVSATYPVPKLAIFPLLMVIFGIGEVSKIVAIALGCFFLALINSMAGVRNINKAYFDVARNYGASPRQLFTKVMLPASLPMIFAGIRLALGTSLLVVVGLEFVSANKGIGALIWYA
ncbi:MAG: ABC transporter permease, partial [Methanoregulaceae archaeon]|nr:ABC transporter permease [Methanoregulaceae archaeon]